ncbi:MAG: hypothetical protein AAFN94_12365 [Pseudomonadota bacterium]
MIRFIFKALVILSFLFLAACEETVPKREFDRLKRQYDQLSRDYRAEIAALKQQLTDIEASNSELSQSLRESINDRLATEEERQALIAEYRKVSNLLIQGNVDEAKVLALQLADTTLSELDVQIIALIQKSERLAELDAIFAEANAIVQDKKRESIIKFLGNAFSIAFVAFGLIASTAVTVMLIRNLPERYDQFLSTVILCTMVIASFTSTATTQVPLLLYLFSSIVGIDEALVFSFVPPFLARIVLETLLPILAGAYIGYLFNKARKSNSSENRDILTVFVLSIIIASIVDAALFYGSQPGAELPFHANLLFAISGLFSAAISRLKERSNVTGEALQEAGNND